MMIKFVTIISVGTLLAFGCQRSIQMPPKHVSRDDHFLINYNTSGNISEIYDYSNGRYYEFFLNGNIRNTGGFKIDVFRYHFDTTEHRFLIDTIVPTGDWLAYNCYGQLKKKCILTSEIYFSKDTCDEGDGFYSIYWRRDFVPISCEFY